MTTVLDRAQGALYGLAIGDALGMPTQMLPREQVIALFGRLDRFEPGPAENVISAGQPAGTVTDDTHQALLLARHFIARGGTVDPAAFLEELGTWADVAEADGTEQLGPTSRRALTALRAGQDFERVAERGETNGAAMRVAPMGIAMVADPLDPLIDVVAASARATHGSSIAIAGAAAVAAAVSAAVGGSSVDEAFAVARRAARAGASRGSYVAGSDIAERINWAVGLVSRLDDASALDAVSGLIGTGMATQETVPAAFAIAARWRTDPWSACLKAAGLGGDSDTIAAIVGAILGASLGASSFPRDAFAAIEENNELGLPALAADLLDIRTGQGSPVEPATGGHARNNGHG
jgi:ADP-ribosylglycohydrolase